MNNWTLRADLHSSKIYQNLSKGNEFAKVSDSNDPIIKNLGTTNIEKLLDTLEPESFSSNFYTVANQISELF